jgi:hypothetical protein
MKQYETKLLTNSTGISVYLNHCKKIIGYLSVEIFH